MDNQWDVHETVHYRQTGLERKDLGNRGSANHKKISDSTMWFKFMHNLHAIGKRKQKMASNMESDTLIEACPCCHRQTETQLHMIMCEANPNRTSALIELTTGGSKYNEHHNFIKVMTDFTEQWMCNPKSQPHEHATASPTTANYDTLLPPHMMEILREALKEQS
jgi:hypothetical protein